MATENICPFCGAPIDSPTSTRCESCGNALTPSASSAATIISPRPSFNSSAEVMDEVKKLAREGDASGAAEVLGTEFGINQEAARQAVDQVQFELKHDGREAASVPPASSSNPADSRQALHPEVIDAPVYESVPKPPSNRRNWIVGGSIGAALVLCVCCCLPILAYLMNMRGH